MSSAGHLAGHMAGLRQNMTDRAGDGLPEGKRMRRWGAAAWKAGKGGFLLLSVILPALAGAAAGVCTYRVFRKRRKQAKAEGKHVPFGAYEAFFKRPLDAALAGTALILSGPALLAAALLVRQRLGPPVLFKQERPGLDGKRFTIYKFRTMTDQRDRDGKLLADDKRLTAFGKRVRSTSLDELPELWNILRGDMSFVGPRPLLPEYLERYDRRQARRHEVRPGLTGLAQVNGRNAVSWEERFEDDIQYVDQITFAGDVRILLQTVRVVLKREGISSGSSETMEAFEGSHPGGMKNDAGR